MIKRLARKPVTWVVVGVVLAAGAFGLYWFQPWKLFTTKTVNETIPVVTTATSPGSGTATGNTLVATGTLVSLEHTTSGSVRLVRLADGQVQVVFENLATSDGPDLHVWLTDQPVISGSQGWRVFDDGRYVELGRLKGNRGNQVYIVPAGTNLTGLISVAIWCKRFAVGFGAAELTPA